MSVCAIAADGFCSGCLRSLEEISWWAAMSPDEQWLVMARLDRRLAQRDGRLAIER
jgi:predicted Fe-S protein YdhL (DUF1289 family)